jgi:NAD(P)H-dependent flavin oxidoreductase YrpB (nitropropane dioxygenase family)
MIQTRVTEMLGIEHPIVMGGMTGVGTPELAAAVSNAGGLGILCAHNAGSPEGCRTWIRQMRRLTKKPFGCNLTILPTAGTTPPPYADYARVFIEEQVSVVETAGSNPKKWVRLFKDAGIITIHKCVTIRHAISAEKMGVDIISLDGFECAGHPGEGDVGNFVLQAVGARVLTTPFICSGGVGDGKQIAAALALGADGVNCGTRFCATQECNWPATFKDRMVSGTEEDTVLMFRRLNNTTRVYANTVAKEVQHIESAKGDSFQFTDVANLVAGTRGRAAEKAGDPDGGIWTAGQVMGLIDDLPTVKELMKRLVDECEATIKGRLNNMVILSRL